MLVQHPHNLCGVHCGAAADRNYSVRLKAAHRLRTLLGGIERRIGSDVKKCRMGYAHAVELVGYHLCVTVFI